MTGLLDAVLAAQGGLGRWRQYSSMEATIVSGGELWQMKGQPQDPAPRRMTVALHREWASVSRLVPQTRKPTSRRNASPSKSLTVA
jgi:hypothetical protein